MSNLLSARRFRTYVYTLLILTFFLLILEDRLPSTPNIIEIDQHLDKPVYEHVSPYRESANRTNEYLLEQELIGIEETLRDSLSQQGKSTSANRTLWQFTTSSDKETWKSWTDLWRSRNEDWELKQFTTRNGPDILQHFKSIPSIRKTLRAHPEIEMNLYRWLTLWYHGGMALEADMWPRLALKDCHPIYDLLNDFPYRPIQYIFPNGTNMPLPPMGEGVNPKQISLVLGIDIDEPYMAPQVREIWGWSRPFSFATYAMWAPERFDPLLRKSIVRCISHVQGLGKRGKVQTRDVGEICGGAMMTDVVLETLSETLMDNHPVRDMDASLARRVTWKKFRALKRPVWIDGKDVRDGEDVNMRGLGVLPINVWGSGQRHSRSGNFGDEDACINHVYGHKPSRTVWQRIFG